MVSECEHETHRFDTSSAAQLKTSREAPESRSMRGQHSSAGMSHVFGQAADQACVETCSVLIWRGSYRGVRTLETTCGGVSFAAALGGTGQRAEQIANTKHKTSQTVTKNEEVRNNPMRVVGFGPQHMGRCHIRPS